MDLRRPLAAALLVAGLAMVSVAGVLPAAAQEGRVIVIVNGLPITSFDIPQRQRLLQIREGRPHTAQQALEDLINDRVKFSEALRFRVAATDSQVEAAYAQVASRSGIDARSFDQVLRSQGVEPRVYKGKLRADLSWSNIVGARFGRTVMVTDSQLTNALNQRRTGANRPMEYNLRPVVLLVPANAPPAQVQRRLQEANALRGRFTSCATGVDQVAQLPDSAVRDNIRRLSTDLSPEFQRVLEQTAVGHLTPPSRSSQGVEMVAVCSKSEVRADDQAARNQVREELTTTQMQRISREYLARLRRTAVIEYKNGGGR